MSYPLVSIIIPAYNREKVIEDTIYSVMAQTYPYWECVIVDDGSTDDTVEVIVSITQDDPRFRIMRRARLPKGAPTCRNIGLDVSNGGYICFLDSDDILSPFFLEKQIKILASNDNSGMVISQTVAFTNSVSELLQDTREVNEPVDIMRYLSGEIRWITSAVLWKKDMITHLGGFSEDLEMWQDWELNVRFLMRCYIASVNNETLVYYRSRWSQNQITANSVSGGNQKRVILNYLKSRKYLLEEFISGSYSQDSNMRRMVVIHLSCLPEWLFSIGKYYSSLYILCVLIKLDRSIKILKPFVRFAIKDLIIK